MTTPSSTVRYCLFSLFSATLLIGSRSSTRNLRTRHAVVTGTHGYGLRQLYAVSFDECSRVYTKNHREICYSIEGSVVVSKNDFNILNRSVSS